MAKVLDPLHSEQANGRCNGQVFYRDGQNNIVRNYVNPGPPTGTGALEQQGDYTATSKQWANLTDSQKKLWQVLADRIYTSNPFGVKRRRTGYSVFMEVNTYRYAQGLGFLDDAPVLETVNRITSVAAVIASTGSDGVVIYYNFMYAPSGDDTVQIAISKISASPDARYRNRKFNIYSFSPANSTGFTVFADPVGAYLTIRACLYSLAGQRSWYIYTRQQIQEGL